MPSTSIMSRTDSKSCSCSSDSIPKTGYEPELKYDSLCDEYFTSKNALRRHCEASSRHPRCDTCQRSFLNLNSLRMHYLLSSRHHYCGSCFIIFDSALALRIHNEHDAHHRKERGEDPRDTPYVQERRRAGWENRIAAEQQRRENAEVHVVVDERDALSQVQVVTAILELKQRMKRQQAQQQSSSLSTCSSTPSSKSKVLKQTCAICLLNCKKMCVTRCGHMFCSACIHTAFENGQGCPSCRKLGTVSQLRKVDLSVC